MLKGLLPIIPLLFFFFDSTAQTNAVNFQLEAQAIATSPDQVPFWFRARQGGSVPLSGLSGSLVGHIYKDYDTTRRRTIDWSIGLEGRANGNKSETDLILVQANAKLKLAMFEIRAGRWRGQTGLTDTLLTSGAFSISGNALGIPQVQISVPEFFPVPFTNGWVAFKGSFCHGWLGKVALTDSYWVDSVKTYFHHKSLYGRLGKPGGLLRVYGGFNHQTFWGNEPEIFGSTFNLTQWQAYQSVLYGKIWAGSKVGNHLGSIDVGSEINLGKMRLLIYRQLFYEIGALAHIGNIADGLNGISLTNNASRIDRKGFRWEKVLLEVVTSMDQAGKLTNPVTPSGAENYYNHYLYANGWSYKGAGLGNTLFTPAKDARPGQTSAKDNYFINNRLIAFHTGMSGSVNALHFRILATYSLNYGTFNTSGQPFRGPFKGIVYPPEDFVFRQVNQLSGLLSIRHMKNSGHSNRKLTTYWGGQVGFDNGSLYRLSSGVAVCYGIKL